MKKMTAILVTWLDANSPADKWMNLPDFKESNPAMKIESLGFFVEQKDNYLRMVGDHSITKGVVRVTNREFNIPLGCILTVEKLHGKK
jgi:hypothetical protein